MTIALAFIGVSLLVFGFWSKDTPDINGWAVLCGFVLISVALGTSGSGGGSDCYVDWDGRSNPTVCD